jgi:hypothetical protein
MLRNGEGFQLLQSIKLIAERKLRAQFREGYKIHSE